MCVDLNRRSLQKPGRSLFVSIMARFGVKTVHSMISPYLRQMVGHATNLATLAGIAFSISGVSNVIAYPLLGGGIAVWLW
jgi:hypothetical protein